MLTLSSPAFEHGSAIPERYTCDGENACPPLTIGGIPEGTQSLALIMEDPDVPVSVRADGMWDHWIVFNIPPATSVIAEGEEPEGVCGIGTGGTTTYYGPCPPDREHRYFFRLYALDTMLPLVEGATKKEVLEAMEGHVLASTELMGVYERIPSA